MCLRNITIYRKNSILSSWIFIFTAYSENFLHIYFCQIRLKIRIEYLYELYFSDAERIHILFYIDFNIQSYTSEIFHFFFHYKKEYIRDTYNLTKFNINIDSKVRSRYLNYKHQIDAILQLRGTPVSSM